MHSYRHLPGKLRSSIVLLAAAGILAVLSRTSHGFACWYSTSIYPLIVGSIGRISGVFPFSAGEILCILLPIGLITDLVLLIRRSGCAGSDIPTLDTDIRHAASSDIPSGKTKESHAVSRHPGAARNYVLHLILVISVLVFLYEANCGVNYYSPSFVDTKALEAAEFTGDDLDGFCEYTADQICSIYEDGSASINSAGDNDAGAGVNNSHTSVSYPAWPDIADTAVESMSALAEIGDHSDTNTDKLFDTKRLSGYYPRPKQLTVLSSLFSKMGVSGIYSPFTVEANINGEMAGLEKPFTACHELSHLKGFMNEGEANFIGWLACINSDDPSFNRSGWLIAWIYAGNSLYRTDPDRYYELRAKLPDEAIRELDDNTEFWASHKTAASEVQDRVNDAYLKSNGQKQGIQTYGQVTTLMLMWYSDAKLQLTL